MSLQVEGTLHEIFDEMQVTDRFKKREFVLEMTDDRGYKEHPKFQLTQNRCSLLDSFNKGEKVQVFFSLSGRPYTKDGRTTYFTNLNAWKVNRSDQSAPEYDTGMSQEPPQVSYNQTNNNISSGGGSNEPTVDMNDDLPF